MTLLNRTAIAEATKLFTALDDLRKARYSAEHTFATIDLRVYHLSDKLVRIDKDAGLAILNSMIETTEGDLVLLGFNPEE